MIKLVKNFAVLVFFFLPLVAPAQTTNPLQALGTYQVGGQTYTPSFTPALTDLSVGYLGQIFGTVGTVLHGTSGQMLGQLFKVFNIGILVVAGIFLIYTITMTVINAAHEGEFMGRKWNSAWIAIRTVLGLGLLVPSATTGYSTVQVIVMFVVIQGIGFANMAWESALSYIAEGGQIYTPPQTDTSDMVNLVGTVLQHQVCMYANQNIWQQRQKAEQKAVQQQQAQAGQPSSVPGTATPQMPVINYVQNWTPYFTTVQEPPGTYRSIVRFPGNPYTAAGKQDQACGQISFGTDADPNILNQSQKAATLKAAVNQIMLDMSGYAQTIATLPSKGGGPSDQSNQNFSTQIQSAIVGAAADWVNITLPIRTGAASSTNAPVLLSNYVSEAASEGWIMAGRYYYALGSIQRAVSKATDVSVNMDFYPAGFPKSWSPESSAPNTQGYINFSGDVLNPMPTVDNMKGLSLSSAEQQILLKDQINVYNYVHPAIALAKQIDNYKGPNITVGPADAGILSFMFSPIQDGIYKSIQTANTATGDPILVLGQMGEILIGVALAAWLVGTIAVFGVGTVVSSLASLNPMPYALSDTLLAFIPVFTVFLLSLATIGGVFAFYVPLIPFIIYAFSAIGWLIAVIEAMVAAPLVALGVTHPEGHDLLGKSEQAIMLLLGVFLRPVLMVIGLIAGMIVSRVVLRFLNYGFFGIVYGISNFNLFGFLAVMFIYASLLVTVVNQSFALIYLIPDRVMRWLGVTEQSTAAQEALQSAKHGYEQIAGAQERLGGGMTQGGGDVFSKALERKRQKKKADEDAAARAGGPQP